MFNEILHWFQNEIFSGNLKPKAKLKSRRFYEIKFNTSKKTIEKVFLTLKNHNFIHSIEKRGYFVNDFNKQNIFKSEKSMIKADQVEVYKKEFSNGFNFNEITKVLNLNNKIYKHNFYGYYKIYKKANAVQVLSCSFNHKDVRYNKKNIQNSFYIAISAQVLNPIKRREIILGGIEYPKEVRNILDEKVKKGVVIYIALFNKEIGLFHVSKKFVKQNKIRLNYSFSF